MYLCPDCKGSLTDWSCSSCGVQFAVDGGIPNLISRAPQYASAREISSTYDRIYTDRSAVWEDQGRTPEFIRYFSNLVASRSTGKLLEVGCGEGFLLSSLQAAEKHAIDISSKALQKARARTQASCSVALAERLPFPDQTFDVVVSVGVMEHFLDDAVASKDILRVLKPGGSYVALIHVELTTAQKYRQKFAEYVFPNFRPFAGLRWLTTKIYKPIYQPIQHDYTIPGGRDIIAKAGFTVEETISLATHRDVPLVGPHVVIYVARKPA